MKKNLNLIPKKSASLIILKQNNRSVNKYFDYSILFIKRPKKVAFSDVYAFPGGVLDQKDTEFSKFNNDVDELKLCALRETFEETGLFFYQQSDQMLQDQNYLFHQILGIKQYFKSSNLQLNDFSQFLTLMDSDLNNDKTITEFIRLVTAPFLPARYDTQFYLAFLKNQGLQNQENQGVINWNNFYNSKQSDLKDAFDLQNISHCKKEVVDCAWLDPIECLMKFQNNQILLAPPQIMILNILCSFQNIKSIEKFINTNIEHPQDDLQKNPFNFPYLFAGLNTKNVNPQFQHDFPYTLVQPGDPLYPLEMILKQEKDSQLKLELEKKYTQLKISNENNSRIYLPEFKNFFYTQYIADVKQRGNTPFNYLKSSQNLGIIRDKYISYLK
ncbi:NUDIX hydrolase domain protein [Pseudocohnilembus persalinus]|uniref:NUDIX hydrolase domain protein n=1 Tax=Pseudocohnilembus persalinus TaxID=266149 RepID=A0A0V0QUG3_PSEPJ|nr:NUDIX hydrolase domain protein [Pseudocohnilembus persalinus]|eukprot:KRX06009.1 NUDIX hydrolase domain protein [Pseudocohnilembus persalinus]